MHALQTAPPVPQTWLASPGAHAKPCGVGKQHPFGQVAGPHSQLPASQRVPGKHPMIPVPQAQPPFAVQRSDRLGSHTLQLIPARPQSGKAIVWQLAPMQQPAPQVPALHTPQTPSLQVALPVQAVHAPPSCPHAAFESPSTHAFPLQQPAAQVAAVQMHWPPTHSVVRSHAWPRFPHEQTPPRQLSARVGEQVVHVRPPVPQSLALGLVMHCAPEQQPLGQVAAEQPTQAPASHAWLAPQAAHAAPPVPHAFCATPGKQLPV